MDVNKNTTRRRNSTRESKNRPVFRSIFIFRQEATLDAAAMLLRLPKLSMLLVTGFCLYMGHSMWTLSKLFNALECTAHPCFHSFLAKQPELQLLLYTSPSNRPVAHEVQPLAVVQYFDYLEPFER